MTDIISYSSCKLKYGSRVSSVFPSAYGQMLLIRYIIKLSEIHNGQ